mmetsp:Transcript_46830/g.108796  ORF Transcript_46830/g.108796 Transcript_46830/m.108796 type:complete len:142 (-) Transcript_46830:490-915(-)
MTTVGYGDTFPIEAGGKLVATVTMVCGLMVLALPLSVVGTNFTEVYEDLQRQRRSEKLRKSNLESGRLSEPSERLAEISDEFKQLRASFDKSVDRLVAIRRLDTGASSETQQVDAYKAMIHFGLDGLDRVLASTSNNKVAL